MNPFAELSNGKITGFAVDLLNEISVLNDFNYTLDLQFDNTYNGMIGEIYRKVG